MENLISLLIDLVTSLLGGANRKSDENTPPPLNRPDPSRQRPPAPRPTSWEDELRRLLDGQGQPQSPPPVSRPPVMAPKPQVPRVIPSAPQPRPLAAKPLPVNLPRPDVRPAMSSMESSARALAPLNQSQQAYTRASQIDQTVSAHMNKVPGQHVQATKVIHWQAPPEVVEAVSFFRNAKAARQAVIATVIFGPPRAVEEHVSSNF